MSFENIDFTLNGGIATLRLNRPASYNALSRPLLTEFRQAIDRLADMPDARVLLLCSEGKAFSSGADLAPGASPVGSPGFDAGAVLEEHYNPIMERLFALSIPIVSAVRGAAAGAGCMLALSADVVIASRTAFFVQSFVNVGLIPDAASSWWLPRLVGAGRASAMMLLGERVSAEQAASWGMIYEMVEDEALEDRAAVIAGKFAAGPTVAYGLARQAIRMGLESTLAESLERERQNQRKAGQTSDFGEGVASFREKRKPDFSGR